MANTRPFLTKAHLQVSIRSTRRNHVAKSSQSTISTNLSTAVSSTQDFSQLHERRSRKTVHDVRSTSVGSDVGTDSLNHHLGDVSIVRNTNFVHELTKVKHTSSNLIPVNSRHNVVGFGVDGDFVVVRSLNRTMENTLGQTGHEERIVGVHLEASSIAPTDVSNISEVHERSGNHSRNNRSHNLRQNSGKRALEDRVVMYVRVSNIRQSKILNIDTASTFRTILSNLLNNHIVQFLAAVDSCVVDSGKKVLLGILHALCHVLFSNFKTTLNKSFLLVIEHREVLVGSI